MFSTSTQTKARQSGAWRAIRRAALAIGLLCFTAAGALAQHTTYVGVWQEGKGDYALYQLNSWEDFVDKWQELNKEKVRLSDIETVTIGDDIKYVGTWVAGEGGYGLFLFNKWGDLVAKWKELDAKGLRLLDVEMVRDEGETYYIGVWGAGKGVAGLYKAQSWNEFIGVWTDQSGKGMRLIDVEAARVGNETHYVGVWTDGGGKQPLYQTDDWNEFVAKWKELAEKDLRLRDIETLRVAGKTTYIGVWESGKEAYALYQSNDWEGFVAKWKEFNGKNLRLIDVALADQGKPAQQGKPPQQGKPAQSAALHFDKAGAMKKDPVTGIDFPADMPPVVWPEFKGCNAADKLQVQKAWAMAHHHMWRAYQLIVYIENSKWTNELWSHGYNASNPAANWSPRAWFGPFADKRFRYDTVRDGVIMAWNDRFLAKRYSFTVQCRRDDGGAHPCYQNNPGTGRPPSANHIVLGKINFCNRFFDGKDDKDRARTVIHELFHHLAPKGLVIIDTHLHSDWSGAWCKTDSDKMYGTTDAIHLASSKGCLGTGLHYEMAARNNDNYAYFILNLGSATYNGSLKQFPEQSFLQSHK